VPAALEKKFPDARLHHIRWIEWQTPLLDPLDPLFAEIARKKKLPIKVCRSDMRRITFDSKFQAAANLWTSFGYFEKKSDDLLTLRRLFRALKPGGMFVLNVINRDWILLHFQEYGWFPMTDARERETSRILEKRKFDYRNSVSRGTWIFQKDGKEEAREAMIRMYAFHELVEMFEKVGFVDVEGYGNTKEEPISREQRMMWVFGTKPKR
jgi:hypothetical protein